jgi:hypothetical protein
MDRRRQKWSTKHYTENFRLGNINPHKIGGGWVDIVCSDRKISSLPSLVTYVIGYIYYCLGANLCQSYGDRAVNYTIQSGQSFFYNTHFKVFTAKQNK